MNVSFTNAEIILKQEVYPWTNEKNIFVRGYAFWDGTLLKGPALAQYFENADAETFRDKLCAISGFFSVVIVEDDAVLAAVDHVRSMPLFYFKKNGKWIITDRLSVDDIKKTGIDEDLLYRFSLTLYVTGRETMCKDVYQLEAGQMVTLKAEPQCVYWWKYSYPDTFISDTAEALNMLEDGYLQTFQRLITVLNGRTAVIPLSGGCDSRLIAYYLKKLGYEKVVAYSYGYPDNEESTIAKQVANLLGIPFYFIEHKRKDALTWTKETLGDFLDFAGNGCAVPCIQEWYAVGQLKARGIIPEDSVFLPGYTGDLVAGTSLKQYFFEKDSFSKQELVHAIVQRHYRGNVILRDEDRTFASQRTPQLEFMREYTEPLSSKRYAEASEKYILMERQAKFIVNALRVYEFYGYEWVIPEFEYEQFQVWLKIDLMLRLNRNVYTQFTMQEYPKELYAIPYAKKGLQPKKNIKYYCSKLSILPWTEVAHYLFIFTPIPEYAAMVYLERNRSINRWAYLRYMKLLK